ncbi:hypothetical protein TWF718_004079 [Orbilia javanica]|uniref:Uncharacterized protein n=1 Tax=Orbilia javanica TaxID=47235 RepID=A0AAN8N5Q1_9PEZI
MMLVPQFGAVQSILPYSVHKCTRRLPVGVTLTGIWNPETSYLQEPDIEHPPALDRWPGIGINISLDIYPVLAAYIQQPGWCNVTEDAYVGLWDLLSKLTWPWSRRMND